MMSSTRPRHQRRQRSREERKRATASRQSNDPHPLPPWFGARPTKKAPTKRTPIITSQLRPQVPKDIRRLCCTTRDVDINKLIQILTTLFDEPLSLSSTSSSFPSSLLSSPIRSMHMPLPIITIISEYSQFVDRLYAFAASSTSASTESYRFYINESLPSIQRSTIDIHGSDSNSKNNSNNGNDYSGWRRVVMTTKVKSDGLFPPNLSTYRDHIFVTWPTSAGVSYQCQVPSPCIFASSPASSRSQGSGSTKSIPSTTKRPMTIEAITENDNMMRVKCGKWHPLNRVGQSAIVTPSPDWRYQLGYSYVGTFGYDKKEDNEHMDTFIDITTNTVHKIDDGQKMTTKRKKGYSTTVLRHCFMHTKQHSIVMSYVVPPHESMVYMTLSAKSTESSMGHIVVQFDAQYFYLFEFTQFQQVNITRYDTFRCTWQICPTLNCPESKSLPHLAGVTIPKVGILLSLPNERLHEPTYLYRPHDNKFEQYQWEYPTASTSCVQTVTPSSSSSSSSSSIEPKATYRHMVWYNNHLLIISGGSGTIANVVDTKSSSSSSTSTDDSTPIASTSMRCFMLSPKLIKYEYRYEPSLSSSSSIAPTMAAATEINNPLASNTNDPQMTSFVTFPSNVAVSDWIRIDDLPFSAPSISFHVTSL
jgi:hypothetical protein